LAVLLAYSRLFLCMFFQLCLWAAQFRPACMHLQPGILRPSSPALRMQSWCRNWVMLARTPWLRCASCAPADGWCWELPAGRWRRPLGRLEGLTASWPCLGWCRVRREAAHGLCARGRREQRMLAAQFAHSLQHACAAGGWLAFATDPLLTVSARLCSQTGLRGEELAVAREVKFQLGSTLRGLGTSNLGEACSDYQVGKDRGRECGLCIFRRLAGFAPKSAHTG